MTTYALKQYKEVDKIGSAFCSAYLRKKSLGLACVDLNYGGDFQTHALDPKLLVDGVG